MGDIIRFHPLNNSWAEEKQLEGFRGMGMSFGQLKNELVQQEIQQELDRHCTGCNQYCNCEQAYQKQQDCWKEQYGHYLEAPK